MANIVTRKAQPRGVSQGELMNAQRLASISAGLVSKTSFWNERTGSGKVDEYSSVVLLASLLHREGYVKYEGGGVSKGFIEHIGHQFVQEWGIRGTVRQQMTGSGDKQRWSIFCNFGLYEDASQRALVVSDIKDSTVAQRLQLFYIKLLDGDKSVDKTKAAMVL
jgi:hypothetical protein